MDEIWRDILGYEDLYQISNLGNVRSLDRKKRN
ncbi:NUMOD4 domain-containing protein, partial [Bacillus paranthracis]